MWGLTFDLATFLTATYSAVLGGAIALAIAWATTKGTRDRMSHNQRKIAEIAAHLYQRVTGDKRSAFLDDDGYLKVDYTLRAEPGSFSLSGSDADVEESAGGE